jgi:polar amino acid transport system substrate-binding protein
MKAIRNHEGGSMRGIRHYRRPLAIVGVAIGLALVATGCAEKAPADPSKKNGVALIKKARLTICSGLPYEPFESQRGNDVVGLDVDLTALIANRLGVSQQYVNTPFDRIRSGQDLKSGKCDLAAAAMTITPEREKVMDLSVGYFEAHQAMLFRSGRPYKSLKDLSGHKVGVQTGAIGEAYVKKQVKDQKLDLDVVAYEDIGAEQQALESGQIEAIVNDLPVWTEYVKENPGKFEIGAEFNTGEQYGMAVKTGNKALLRLVNDVLKQAKEDGTYNKIYQKWIGRKPSG